MGELKKRVLAGICIAPVIAFLFYILPPVWLLVLLMAICVVAVLEAASLGGYHMRYLIAVLVIAGTVPLFLRFFQIYMLWVMASAFIIIAGNAFNRKTPVEEANRDLTGQTALVLFCNFFILVPFFYLYLLKELGEMLPLILLVSIWASDTFAYAIGKRFGKHPLAPQISPKKTVEGLAGSALGSLVVITASYHLLGFSIAGALVVGAATGILGQAGDLFESACKRVFNIKDSSQLIPGHGGLLDRIDSFIFTAPFLYTCLVWTR
ncbi:MAG: phosphatidate cytidylyltransferase [Syntrophorhabdaceae bacterium]|nr:phosphatidate cytidylyltransferase [Syntrophorhabdaceae bacterium]